MCCDLDHDYVFLTEKTFFFLSSKNTFNTVVFFLMEHTSETERRITGENLELAENLQADSILKNMTIDQIDQKVEFDFNKYPKIYFRCKISH